MVTKLLHRLAASPWVYDRLQRLVGVNEIYRRVAKHIGTNQRESRILDAGGGTGSMRKLWPADCAYVCLDIEMAKLQAFRHKVRDGHALLGDATAIPVATESTDVVICMAVAHHLTDPMLAQMLTESRRVLKRGGRFILVDPVLAAGRPFGRLLWRLDRGAYPRTADRLRDALEQSFQIVHWEQFAIYHEYVFGIAIRPH